MKMHNPGGNVGLIQIQMPLSVSLMCVSAYLRCLWVAGVIYEGADLFGALILDE